MLASLVRGHAVQPRHHASSALQRPWHAPSQIRIRHRAHATVQARLPRWDQMYPVLTSKQLRSVSPEEAKLLADSGAVLVDVRRQDIFSKGHVEGAVNIPMFQLLDWEKPSAGKVLKLIACAVRTAPMLEDLKDH